MIDLAAEDTLTLTSWTGPRRPKAGVHPTSAYVDRFWVPVIGPTATCLLRCLCHLVARADDHVEVRTHELAAGLGLHGPDAPIELERAFARLERARLLEIDPTDTLRVAGDVPYLSLEQVGLLSAALQASHAASFRVGAGLASTGCSPSAAAVRMRRVAGAIDELATNAELTPRQHAYRWHHLVRLAEEARDEAVIAWAAPDLETTLAEGQLRAQSLGEAMWHAVHAITSAGHLPDDARTDLAEGAAGIVDWIVAEFPSPVLPPWLADHPDS